MALQGPLPPHLQRCLQFIKVANDGGAYPSVSQLDAYAQLPEPSPPVRVDVMTGITSTIAEMSTTLRKGQPVAAYMRDVGWVTAHGSGLELTPLGSGLVSGLVGVPHPGTERGVVLDPANPARYEVLVRSLAAAGQGMLADPYFKPEFIDLLVTGTSLTRLLLSHEVKGPEQKLIALALFRLSNQRSESLPEVRVSSDRRFHDRYLLHKDGAVDLIGASVNSLDTRVTAIVPVHSPVTEEINKHLESLWDSAEPIQPALPRVDEAAASNEKDSKAEAI